MTGRGRTLKYIVIIEDDAALGDSLGEFLADQGYGVARAGTVAKGLDLVREIEPALILSDFKLPDGSGLDVLRGVRESAGASDTPVIMLSGWASKEQMLAAMTAGADDYLVKPCDPDEIFRAIEALAGLPGPGAPSLVAESPASGGSGESGEPGDLASFGAIDRSPSERPGGLTDREDLTGADRVDDESGAGLERPVHEGRPDGTATTPEDVEIPWDTALVDANARLATAFRFILEQYAEPISLKDVAHHVGYSAAYLTDLCRRVTGQSLQRWVIELRMNDASRRLSTTDTSVDQISRAVGYQDTGYFIRQFRLHFGNTPQAWRQAQRGALHEAQRQPQRDAKQEASA